jgi:zinc-binding alcohol dehydrogenase/oxidoreductase
MKALVLTNKNQPLVVQEVEDLKPGKTEVIVKIHAAALNHRDVWIQQGQYAGLKYPIILGSDGSGIVYSTGSDSDEHWIGKEVIICPSLDWGMEQSHQHPEHFRILGLPDEGTFAEFVRVPASNIFEKPKHLSFEEAAALPLAGLTAYRAIIKRAGLQNGEKILITGIGGGVALFALQYAKIANADIYVTSGDEEKIAKAILRGAKGGANYQNEQWPDALQNLAGSFDVIIDGAAGNGFDALLNLAKPGGRIVLYGATKGNPANLTARRIFWKQLNVLGSTMGSPTDFHEMIDFVEMNKIIPVVDKIFAFDEGELAMRRMTSSHQFGKIVIKM